MQLLNFKKRHKDKLYKLCIEVGKIPAYVILIKKFDDICKKFFYGAHFISQIIKILKINICLIIMKKVILKK